MALPAAAQDWNWRYRRYDDQANRVQADIARDRAQLNEDIRCGRSDAAARDAADLARDQQTLGYQHRDRDRDRDDGRFSYYRR